MKWDKLCLFTPKIDQNAHDEAPDTATNQNTFAPFQLWMLGDSSHLNNQPITNQQPVNVLKEKNVALPFIIEFF